MSFKALNRTYALIHELVKSSRNCARETYKIKNNKQPSLVTGVHVKIPGITTLKKSDLTHDNQFHSVKLVFQYQIFKIQ